MDEEKVKDTKSFFKEWLEQLQMESWQLELLISGLALFGIYEARPLLQEYNHFSRLYIDGIMDTLMMAIGIVLKVGWKIFFINLLIHVILRGLWIGTIGLRYVSGEIDYDALGYSDRFRSYLERRIGSYDDFIERLEYICSVLFAYTFLLFLLFLSFILFFVWIPLIVYLAESTLDSGADDLVVVFTMLGYFVLGVIVFIDFISLGAFKKIRDNTVSRVYMWIYRFYSTLTLSFLYRPLIYNFIDNKGTRRLFFLSLPYILLLIVGDRLVGAQPRPYFRAAEDAQYGESIDICHYDDLRHGAMIRLDDTDRMTVKNCYKDVVLDKFYMDSEYPSVFFKMMMRDKELLEQRDVEPFYKEGVRIALFSSKKNDSEKIKSIQANYDAELSDRRTQISKMRRELRRMDEANETRRDMMADSIDMLVTQRDSLLALEKSEISRYREQNTFDIIDHHRSLHLIRIDGVDYSDSLTCHFYKVPENGVEGLLCHFPSSSIRKGPHMLTVEKTMDGRGKEITKKYHIPFIKIK